MYVSFANLSQSYNSALFPPLTSPFWTLLPTSFPAPCLLFSLPCLPPFLFLHFPIYPTLILSFPKTTHKKTFLYLEQLMLKHRAHVNALRIKESHDGIDFYFAQKQDARKLVDFFTSIVPCK